MSRLILVFFLISVLLFQVGTFGTPQQADAHRVGNMAECVKVKVKAEILSITVDKWKGKSKKYFDPPGLVGYDQYGEVEIAYSFWEPDHNGKGQGGKVDGVIELSKWSLSKSKTIPYTGSNAKDSYLFPKHTILLHDTCWADVDNLVVTMAVQELDDGESYKKAWYSTSVKKWWTGTLIETALTTVVDKIVKGPVGTVLTLPKSIYDATHITKNDFLGSNSKVYDLEELDTKKYYYYNFKTKGDSGEATIKFRVVILEDPDKQAGLYLPSDDSSAAISDTIPGWIKNNADWWSQGLISDRDFAAGLGFMVKEKLIRVDNIAFDLDGSVVISDDLAIPKWIHTNAKWWVDGAITDDDFKSGIQFMVKEKLIDFTAKKPQPNQPELDEYTKKQLVQLESNILIANNLVLEQLLEMQNYIISSLDDSTDEAWSQYSENKNPDYMNRALNFEVKLNKIKGESEQTIQTLKDSEKVIGVFFDAAKSDGYDIFVLRNNAEGELLILDAPSIHTSNDLKNAGKYLKKFDGFIQNNLDAAESLSGVPISQSSSFSKEFGVSGVEDADSKYHGIDSQNYKITCTSDSTCDSAKVEQCAKRTGETSGYCIPTWFGIAHAWAPIGGGEIRMKYYTPAPLLDVSVSSLNLDSTTDVEEDNMDSNNNPISDAGAEIDTTTTNGVDSGDVDFTIEANPMSLTLSNGEYGEILVKTKSLNGWESPVQITTPIIPSPMTYPPGYPHYVYPTPESETSSIIPVQISGYACTGNYILRVFGYGEHPAADRVLEIHSVNVEINTIREPSLELDSLENPITIVQGGSHTFQLSFKSLDYADYSYIVGPVDSFSPPSGVGIATPPTYVSVPEQTTVYAPVTITTSASTAPTTFELPIYAETGLDCYNPYRETTSVTVNIVPIIDEETEMVQLIPVTALSIGDQQYPISQFTLWQWEGECDDAWHYHSSTGHAVALDGITGMSDPDQANCGFGKVSSFPNLSGWMSQSQIDHFKELTGYDPLNSEAQMGGSGP